MGEQAGLNSSFPRWLEQSKLAFSNNLRTSVLQRAPLTDNANEKAEAVGTDG